MGYCVARIARGMLKNEAPVLVSKFAEAEKLMLHYLNRDLYYLDRRAVVSKRKRTYRIFNGVDYAKVRIYKVM